MSKRKQAKSLEQKQATKRPSRADFYRVSMDRKRFLKELPATCIQKLDTLIDSLVKQCLRHNTFILESKPKNAAQMEKIIGQTESRIEKWLDAAFDANDKKLAKGIKAKTKQSRHWDRQALANSCEPKAVKRATVKATAKHTAKPKKVVAKAKAQPKKVDVIALMNKQLEKLSGISQAA